MTLPRSTAAVGRAWRWTFLVLLATALPSGPAVVGAENHAAPPSNGSWIRVGLSTDEQQAAIAARDGLQVIAGGEVIVEHAPQVVVRPAGRLVHPWTYRLQAGAMREPDHAQRFAAELERATGLAPDLAFDAQTGLTRVRLGEWARRSEAESEQTRLKAAGRETWVVEEPGLIEDPALELVAAGTSQLIRSDLRIRRIDGSPVGWNGVRYRGELGLVVNRRGQLNVILHTNVEDYLRGVVPKEMGPRIYDDLEALKALTVAARSYVLHNLGEFESEGFDVCATTRCQVFGGVGVEHPLADQAIDETSGLILKASDGSPAEALYTATCGGHTEDVATVFPAKSHDYLRGVPCVEGAPKRINSRANWNLIESQVVDSLVGELGATPQQIGESFHRLMDRAGVPAADDALAGFQRDEVRRFLGSVFDLVVDPAWLAGVDPPHLDAPPLARSLHQVAVGQGAVKVAQLRRILYQAGEITGLVAGRSVAFSKLDGSGATVVRGGGEEWKLPAGTPWHWRGEGATRLTYAGDPLHLILVENQPQAILVPTRRMRSAAAAPSTKVWSEFRSDEDLVERTAREFPGFHLHSIELGTRGVSGRVGSLILKDVNGERRVFEGLPIRWFLEIPETWFEIERTASPQPGWMFQGRGWGHGVGMCQRGTYRMSLRGARFDEILDYYYTGLRLGLYDEG